MVLMNLPVCKITSLPVVGCGEFEAIHGKFSSDIAY